MEQHGDAATETTWVLSTKLLQTLRCQRRRALHHCGDPDRFQQLCWRLWIPQTARFRSVLEGTHAWCFLHPTQNSRPASNQSKLPSWDMPPPGFRRLAQFPITSRRTWPTNSTQRASCTTSSRAGEKAHQRYHERPFALFVTVRPFTRVRQPCAKTCTSSRSDLMTFRILWQRHVLVSSSLFVLHSCMLWHSLCATTLTNTTSWRKQRR